MLDSKTIKKIEDFVYKKPRSIQEIALYLNKNWRTADRYVKEIEKEYNTIATRTFREGTRGALKIVYWNSVEKISNTIFQEELEKDLFNSKGKEDFSSFDIYQYINNNKKESFILENEEEAYETAIKKLLEAKKQVLIFSGNLSFINLKNKKNWVKTFETLLEKNVSVKVLSRVDLSGMKNIEKLLNLNYNIGKELIEIRHNEQPLRGFIIDKKILWLKELNEPTGKINELNKKKFLIYNIKDKEWIEWLSKIFWKKFSTSRNAEKRLEELKKIKEKNL